MTRAFLIAGDCVAADGADLPDRLEQVYRARARPLCLCRPDGVPMYVARSPGGMVLKRMPLTGPEHDPACESYEPPPELSGRGEVQGSAIAEDATEGVTRLRFDFSLSKRGRRAAAAAPREETADTARTDGSKLTLRGLLHFLWEEAELNHWSPGMAGRRTWAVVRHRLLDAAANKAAKGAALSDHLFVPETFAAERKAEIAGRRAASLKALSAKDDKGRSLMVLIGEVKEIAPARFGHRLVIKHLPDMPLMLADDVHRRVRARFAAELELADGVEGARLVAIATFGRGATGIAAVEEIALVATTEQWVPIEHAFDAALMAALSRSGARFVKGLRYNLARARPLASVVLPTTRPRPTALYVIPPGADDAHRAALDELVSSSDLAPWIWDAEAGMPPLPSR